MSWMKVLILQASIATLTCSLLATFTTIANAKPFVEKINRQIPNTEISGNIVAENSNIGNIPCNTINVTLKEFIPVKPEPGRFSIPKEKTLATQLTATGNTLAEGCSYNLGFRYFSKIGAYGASSFQISAQASQISGTQSVNEPFPSNINIQVFSLPAPPR
ncbi:hypothetical protein [Calothrix sp. PCC 6303]|uniref:hypothetical protein n=1 Tax=Calothrix sp. PCC 6303 TaxID=1170562 RepID=UPI0002A02AE9|nr:hypothetical protein [Calothrix sp. PCC 6303]AFZ01252.1 hypothetical protein Cal6303_2235 [Calothrix sp. PCC 6303]